MDQPTEIADALNALATAARLQGNFKRAEALLEETLVLRRKVGVKPGVVLALVSLAQVTLAQAEYDKTLRLLSEALALQSNPSDRLGSAATLETVVDLALARGSAALAARLLGAADGIRETMHLPRSAARRADYEHTVSSLRARLGEVEFASQSTIGREMSLEQSLREASELLESLSRGAALT